MFNLAKEMLALGRYVVTTTTTKIFPPEPEESPVVLLLSENPSLKSLSTPLSKFGHVTIGGSILSNGKLDAVDEETILQCLNWADHVVVEADGAAKRSVKAPDDWEPVIPCCADLVIPVVGLDCLGRPATEDTVFRLDRFLEVSNLQKDEVISAQAVGRLLAHPDGGLKAVPLHARVIPFLNKLDLVGDPKLAEQVAHTVFANAADRIERLVVGKLKGTIAARVLVPGQNHL